MIYPGICLLDLSATIISQSLSLLDYFLTPKTSFLCLYISFFILKISPGLASSSLIELPALSDMRFSYPLNHQLSPSVYLYVYLSLCLYFSIFLLKILPQLDYSYLGDMPALDTASDFLSFKPALPPPLPKTLK